MKRSGIIVILLLALLVFIAWIFVQVSRPGLKQQAIKQEFKPLSARPTDPVKGSRQPEITVITFSSFTCAACKRLSATLDQLLALYPDKLKIVWKDAPLDENNARPAAQAARCAQLQGRFWQYHDLVFQGQDDLLIDTAVLTTAAQTLQLDMGQFNRCLSQNETTSLVDDDVSDATAANISAVPLSELNGIIRVEGEASLAQWQQMITELKK